jgi:hypothetical protein
MSRFPARALLAFMLTALPLSAATAQEQPKWFVLRDHQIGSCWTQLLIKVAGEYRHSYAQTAGGPYDTREQAFARKEALQETGTCQR